MGRTRSVFDRELEQTFPRAFDLLCNRGQLSEIQTAQGIGENNFPHFWEAKTGKKSPTKKQLIHLLKFANELGFIEEVLEVLCDSDYSPSLQSSSRQLGLPLALAHGRV